MPRLKRKAASQKLSSDRQRKRRQNCNKSAVDEEVPEMSTQLSNVASSNVIPLKGHSNVKKSTNTEDVSPDDDGITGTSAVNFGNAVDGTGPEMLMAAQLQKELNLQVSKSKKRRTLTESELQNQRIKDKERKRKKRKGMTEMLKLQQKAINKLHQQKTCNKLTEKQKNEKKQGDKLQKLKYTSKMSDQQKKYQRELNKTQHRDKRSQMMEEEKNKRRQFDKTQHRNRRSQMMEDEKMREDIFDKTQHRDKRGQMMEEDKNKRRHFNKTQHRDKRSQMMEEEKNKRRQFDKTQHRDKRSQMMEDEKNERRQFDKRQHRGKRNQMMEEEKNKRRQFDKTNHREKRSKMTEEEKYELQQKSTTTKQSKRQEKRTTLNDLYASYEQDLSSTHDAVNAVVQNFLKVIQDGPTYTCCICYRMLYRNSVKYFTDKYKDKIATLSINVGLEENEMKWICQTCSSCLMKNKIPAQALCNNLKVNKPHPVFNKMCNLEKQLISKIIPFMKIFSLPKGSQQDLKGHVVLVPSNVQSTANSLPRDTRDAQIIPLNLKRRLSDKHAFCEEFIRPQLVNEAFEILKTTNKHYEHILLNENCIDNSKEHDGQLWKKTCRDPDSDTMENNTYEDNVNNCESPDVTDSEDEVEKEIPLDVAEEISYKRSLNNTSCLYLEKGQVVRSNKILNLAPAEGQTPTSVFYQDHWETFAFPTLFPDGINKQISRGQRNFNNSQKYVNARLLSKDFRFAESAEYTFQCLHWIESVSVSDGITFALKKARQDDVSVLALQNPENLLKMFKDDEIFASFKRIRGTPQYWKEMQQDMLAKSRYYGPYTVFISCSAADFHWPELIQIVAKQYGEHYDLQYIEKEMDKKETKQTWLARNPVTVARHIDFIFRKLWGRVILSGLHPVGQILNYDIRKEMQSRGTAHFHSAVHVKDAPIVDKNPDDDVISFIDKHISSVVPQAEDDDNLRNLVLSRQVHHHTRTCKTNKGLECRFHFQNLHPVFLWCLVFQVIRIRNKQFNFQKELFFKL